MRATHPSRWHFLAATGLAVFLSAGTAAQSAAPAPHVAADEIGGVVSSRNGAEAGVWVIAETHDFATRFAKIVVTDEAGRYLLPDLPRANYRAGERIV